MGEATITGVVLNQTDIQFYLNPPSNVVTHADSLPAISCQMNCSECVTAEDPPVPFAGVWGEFLIVSSISTSKRGTDAFGCSDEALREESVQILEAMIFALDVFNKGEGPWETSDFPSGLYLSGKLGLIAFNDCESPLRAEQLLSNWFTKQVQLKDNRGRLYDPDKVPMLLLFYLNITCFFLFFSPLIFWLLF